MSFSNSAGEISTVGSADSFLKYLLESDALSLWWWLEIKNKAIGNTFLKHTIQHTIK